MTVTSTLVPVAHHALILAIPFVVPCVLMIGGLLFLAARDRRAERARRSGDA